jgi:hypothetical protein
MMARTFREVLLGIGTIAEMIEAFRDEAVPAAIGGNGSARSPGVSSVWLHGVTP